MTVKKLFIFSLSLLLIPIFIITPLTYASTPEDIQNHWAQDYIMTLLDQEIMKTDETGLFKPDSAISRGEFALALARQQGLLPAINNKFNDLNNYPQKALINSLSENNIMSGYPDGSFRPEQAINRAEAVSSIIKLLGIREDKETINLNKYNPFTDIPNDHWATNYIKIAAKLDLLVEISDKEFNPGRPITKAEAAKLIARLNDMAGQTGYITDVFPTSKKISVNMLEGDRKVFSISENTLVGRNNRIVSIEDILKTDKVFMITDGDNAKYLKAYGMVTRADLTTEVSKMTQGILNPTEIEALAEGNIGILQPKMINAIKNQLKTEGLTNDEITAIMNTEWEKLETLSKSRLSEAVSIQTGLPLVITRGILDGDWEQIKTYAQIEVVQRVIQQLLSSQLIS